MATGDRADMLARLRAVLPGRWFPTSATGEASQTPVIDGALAGIAEAWAWVYDLIAYANLQTRIATATGVFLDMIGLDFLGTRIVRRSGQSDDAWRKRLQVEILRPRVTRASLASALFDLTGRAPVIFEPANATDTGGYGSRSMTVGTGLGYGLAGGYGSLALPFQAFVTAYRPHTGGVPSVAGYGVSVGGYGVGKIEYASLAMVRGAITDGDIQETVASTIPAGSIGWLRISP